MKKLPLLALSIAPLNAALVLEETFSYDPGSVAGQNGGLGFSAAWTNTRSGPQIIDPTLTAGALAAEGNSSRGAAWSGVQREIGTSLSSAGLTANGATLWFSVIFDLTGQNSSNADLNLSLGSDQFVSSSFGDRENLLSGEGIGVTHSRGTLQGVYWQDSGDGDAVAERNENNSSLVINGSGGNPSQALIVGSIEWGATDTDGETLTLYNPATDLTLGAPIMTAWTTAALDQSTFDRIAIQYKDTPQVDEIRYGAFSADVLPAIPEPSSAVLIALSLGGLGIRRRR